MEDKRKEEELEEAHNLQMGLLAKIDFYNIEDMNKLKFDKEKTEIVYRKRSFIYDFLSSVRQKVNDPLGVRKKRREQGQ